MAGTLSRQLRAAKLRSAFDISNCTSFSAAANVEESTFGPKAWAVPNAGGAPGGSSAGLVSFLRHPAAMPSRARDECLKNCLRDLDIFASGTNHHFLRQIIARKSPS